MPWTAHGTHHSEPRERIGIFRGAKLRGAAYTTTSAGYFQPWLDVYKRQHRSAAWADSMGPGQLHVS